eukprot:gene2386-3226_t
MSNKTAIQLLDDLIAELDVQVSNSALSQIQLSSNKEEKIPEIEKINNEVKSTKIVKEKEVKSKSSANKLPELTINAVDLRVGVIVKVERHSTADKLYCEEIDVGEEQPRAIASGLVAHYTLEQMQNRRLIVVCNLKPRNLVGFKSHGMVLCAVKTDENGIEKVEFIDPPADAKPGDRVIGEGLDGETWTPNQIDKQKAFETIAANLVVDENGIAKWSNYRLVTKDGSLLTAPTIRNGIMR